MKNDNIINGNCWVACFDILGFRNYVLDFERQYQPGHLDAFVEEYYKDILEDLEEEKMIWPQDVFTSWASDTFVLFAADDSAESFKRIATEAENFCVGVIYKQWPIRGALGTGQLYVEKQNHIFVGSALIDSYSYAQKQNWIGLVITPDARSKLEATQIDPWGKCDYAEYRVPITRKPTTGGVISVQSDTERLFAAKIGKHSQVDPRIKQMQQEAQSRYPDDYASRYKEIYENTFKFIRDTN